jgi:hypothetical protein
LKARRTARVVRAAERLSLLTVAETRMNWGLRAVRAVAVRASGMLWGKIVRARWNVAMTVSKPKSKLHQRPI